MPIRCHRDLKSGEKECISDAVQRLMGAVSYLEGNVRGEFNKALALLTVCKM